MAIQNGYSYQQTVYVHLNTSNKSFLDMHQYLKDRGIKNNNFFLALLDPDLAHIDPRDPNLNLMMKRKVLRECILNYWYFIREVIRIPDQGGQVGSGLRYQLHRGNLAMNFGFVRNWNMNVELPRQNYKTMSANCRYLWSFNFGTSNSEMMYINYKHERAKANLSMLKALRDNLPEYLRMDVAYGKDGKKLKNTDRAETLEHPTNGNIIKTMASARNKNSASTLGRGCTQPIQWYDEYAFIPFNSTIYLAATPAFKTASMNAFRNKAPYGILITTTPGDLKTAEGLDAFDKKNNATPFNELYYDYTENQLNDLISKNTKSKFIYIRYTYKQLGRTEQWFRDMCIEMEQKWSDIRREVLLEWSTVSDNSPFTKEELNQVKMFNKDAIYNFSIGGYLFNVYEPMDLRFAPIIGVDVSGGFKQDSSTISIIDSRTTKVVADFKCNYISPIDLAKVIYELVTKYAPNAVVNIERNGGFGSSVIAYLMKTSIKRNLYYEIKEKAIEEKVSNGRVTRTKQKMKVYGTDNNHNTRENLMQILKERMMYHKDKFLSPLLYEELEGLEVKKNGRIEHSSTSHDDLVFAYLMALYVWYEGKHLREVFGIVKQSIKTDEDMDGIILDEESKLVNICESLGFFEESEVLNNFNEIFGKKKSYTYQEYEQKLLDDDQKALENLLSTTLGRKAYSKKYSIEESSLEQMNLQTKLPDSLFNSFYN